MADYKEDTNRVYVEAELYPEAIEKWLKFVNEGDKSVQGNRPKWEFSLEVKKHLSALGWVFAYTMKKGGRRELRYKSPQGKWFTSLVKACMSCVEDPRGESVCQDEVSCVPSNTSSDSVVEKKRKRKTVKASRKVNEEDDEVYCDPRDVSSGFEDKKERKRVRVSRNDGNRRLGELNEEEDGVSCVPSERCSDFKVKERERIEDCGEVKVNKEGLSCAPRDLCSGFEEKKEWKRIRVRVKGRIGRLIKVNEEEDEFCSDFEGKKEKEKVGGYGNGVNEELVKVNGEENGLSCAPSDLSSGFNGVRFCKSLKKILELMEKKSILEKNEESLRFLRRGCNGDDDDDDGDDDDGGGGGGDDVGMNSEVCSVCYWGGELLLCDGCPSSYHHTCLGLTSVPDEDLWFCPSCCCDICGSMEFNHSTLMTCVHCQRRFHLKCLKEDKSCLSYKGWFCSNQCDRVYSSLQKLLGHEITVGDDGLVWTLLKAPSVYEHNDEQQMSVLRSAVKVLHEGFEPSKDPFSGRDLVEELILRKDEDCVKHHGFYTVVVKRKKRIITVASIRVGKDVAEIPLVTTRSRFRKSGMCRILMNELEKQMIKMGVCELVLPAAEAMLTTWTKRFGFSVMTSDERLKVVKHGILDFAGTVLCRKSLSK